ncbi:MAG: galactokinase [Candidatus Hodarchaeales archaeon]|jgi:galactokinase
MDISTVNSTGTGASAPGRVCLYGEHQDYLGLPVIAATIDLRTTIDSHTINNKILKVRSKNIPESDNFRLDGTIEIGKGPYKYLRAVISVLKERYGWQPNHGLELVIASDVPVGSGLSSSAALLVSFTGLLDKHYGLQLSVKDIAEISYIAEHDICGISCGRMDQYSTAVGELIYLETGEDPRFESFSSPFPYLVLGDTLERRAADDALRTRKLELERARQKLGLLDYHSVTLEEVDDNLLEVKELQRVECVLRIRDITRQALDELHKNEPDLELLGQLMTEQHVQLGKNYEVSSPKLDLLVETANKNGALGAKLTGAGLAGYIVVAVATKEDRDRVVEVINTVGGKAYPSKVSGGLIAW